MQESAKKEADRVVAQFKSSCAHGNHELKEVFRVQAESNCDAVVRHCITCGAVVVDRETDERRMGCYVAMRFSNATKVLRGLITAS